MSLSRNLSLAASLVGTIFNLAFALRLNRVSRSLLWENESEWEGSSNIWFFGDSVKLIWSLLFAYFAVAAASCAIGFIGILKNIRSCVRIYRDYSIADLVFVAAAVVCSAYVNFRNSYVRASVCEEFSRQPELTRELGELGLSLENCELWFDRAFVAILGLSFIWIVIRLHVVIALSRVYSRAARSAPYCGRAARTEGGALQRIYLLPTPTTTNAATQPGYSWPGADGTVTIYATVPIGSLSEHEARRMRATEAWVSGGPARSHRHSHSHSRSGVHAVRSQPTVTGDEKTAAIV